MREACELEVRAFKPGNVSVHASGHGMVAEDFLRSASIVAPIISQPGLCVGERIRRSVEATVAAVGCNTNLGIVLLLAPLVEAVMMPFHSDDLRYRTREILAALTIGDAESAYAAIRCANPGGLGTAGEQDVSGAPTVTLLAAMAIAAERDRIARQYACGYEDVFEIGLPALRVMRARGWNDEWAAVACYLEFLAAFVDSHIVRKFGQACAELVRQQASRVESLFKACDNPLAAVPMLLNVDKELKKEGINPGTSADLTVATLAADRFDFLLKGG